MAAVKPIASTKTEASQSESVLPITLTAKTVPKAAEIAREQVVKATAELNQFALKSRTPLKIQIEPDTMRSRGLPSWNVSFEPGASVDPAQLAQLQMNSVMHVTVSSNQPDVKPSSFNLALANDNMAKRGVQLLSAKQIVAAVKNYAANNGKTITPAAGGSVAVSVGLAP
jgi:hypothetical protein